MMWKWIQKALVPERKRQVYINQKGRIIYTQKPETQQQVIDRLLNDW